MRPRPSRSTPSTRPPKPMSSQAEWRKLKRPVALSPRAASKKSTKWPSASISRTSSPVEMPPPTHLKHKKPPPEWSTRICGVGSNASSASLIPKMKPALDVDGAPFPCTTGFLNPEDPIPEYRNNPLIGALGPVAEAEARFDALYEPPPYDVSACNLAPHLRAHVVRSLSGLLVPMPAHDRAQPEIDIMVRRTYLHRNLPSEKYRRQVRADRDLLLAGSLPPERFANSPLLGAAVLGPPGVGKTTLMRLIVSQHPQVIHHAYEL